MKHLDWYYAHKDYFMLTAHRGASFEFPENTIPAMEKAIEAGADMIEFDLRGTIEDIPVLLHDETIDRTSNGHGLPEESTLEQLKKFNFSYFLQNERRTAPLLEECRIPTFEEILERFRDKVCMNIQLYPKTDKALQNACALFRKYDMYGRAYCTVCMDAIEKIRAIDPDIELCTTRGWQTRSEEKILRLCRESDKCRFVQPIKEFTDEKAYDLIKALGMRSNTFVVDDPEELPALKAMGCQGILTNKIHLMSLYRP